MVFSFQQGSSHEVFVDLPGAFTAFADGPYDEGLSPAHIACREYFGNIGLIAFFGGFDIASFVQLDAELLEESFVLGVYEAHGKESKLAGYFSFAAWHFYKFCRFTILCNYPFKVGNF